MVRKTLAVLAVVGGVVLVVVFAGFTLVAGVGTDTRSFAGGPPTTTHSRLLTPTPAPSPTPEVTLTPAPTTPVVVTSTSAMRTLPATGPGQAWPLFWTALALVAVGSAMLVVTRRRPES